MAYTLDEIIRLAVPVELGMEVTPLSGKSQSIYFEMPPKKAYGINNGIIVFRNKNGECYAIPELGGIEKLLERSDYLSVECYVPFSNWSYPTDYKSKWENLLNEKRMNQT